jgi:hypothetical protein
MVGQTGLLLAGQKGEWGISKGGSGFEMPEYHPYFSAIHFPRIKLSLRALRSLR